MVRTQVQLTEEQARRLKTIARKRKVSMAALVREGADHVIRSGGVGDAEIRRRALAVVGRFRSGVRDLARNHDKYFAEAR